MATGVTSRKPRTKAPYHLSYEGKLPREDVFKLRCDQPEEIPTGTDLGRLFQGDNLSALLSLRKDPLIRHQVRCVYIDPPFATAMAFVDRRQDHAYDDALTGASYIEFMRRRLVVLHDILADDGVIFVHLDQNMVFEMKLMLDEVFGRQNFRNFITRKKCNTKNYTRHTFGNISDHILFYSKTSEYVWHRPYDPWPPDRVEEEYPYVDAATGRRYKRVPIHAPGTRRGETGKPWRGKLPPPGKHWQYVPSRLEQMDKAGEIYWSPNGNPRRKVFFDPGKGIPAQDIWLQFRDAHNQNVFITGYPTEKNFDLLLRIIGATTNPGDLVLDCFCGSGTTLEAATLLGRRSIGVDSSDAAITATLERLRHGRQRMGDYVTPEAQAPRTSRDQLKLFDAPRLLRARRHRARRGR